MQSKEIHIEPKNRRWRTDELRSIIEKSELDSIIQMSILSLINNLELDGLNFVEESQIILSIDATLAERIMTIEEAIQHLKDILQPQKSLMSIQEAKKIKPTKKNNRSGQIDKNYDF